MLVLAYLTLSLCAEAVYSKAYPPLGHHRGLLKKALQEYNSSVPLTCLAGEAPSISAPRSNVWAQISANDNLAVWNLLHAPSSNLNLTAPDSASQTDNYVFWIDTVHSNKSEVLGYLDGEEPNPSKYARAVIFEGGKATPGSQEYMIGPLPVSDTTKITPMDYHYNGGSGGFVPFNARYIDGPKEAAMEPLITETLSNISDITAALFQGAVYFGPTDNRTNLLYADTNPLSWDGEQCFRPVMLRLPNAASYMTPLDFFVFFDCTGTDASHYFVKGYVTNEKWFPSEASLRNAFNAGELGQEFQQSRDDSWALLDYKPEMGLRDLEQQFAPNSIELGGKRYRIDRNENYISYLGWTFYLAHSRTLGVMLFDIKFKGERILYELSMQEATAQYGGNQPKAAATVYHDTYYGLGSLLGTLIEGFDCPFGSTMLPMSYHERNETRTVKDAICVFESDANFPISRHREGDAPASGYDFSNLGVVKGTALTVRNVATVGNYDYMFDYVFHTEGSLEVIVRASGYLQSSWYYPAQGNYGPRIHDATQGSLHSHVLTWKADFDILNSANTLKVSELQPINVSQPWFPELGTFEQMALQHSYKTTEEQFNWAPNNQAMYTIVNRNATNRWGEERGYRIVPGRSNVHLPAMNSPFSLRQTEFSKSHLAITRQHDTEPYANSWQNLNLPRRPQQDFVKFFDGESMEQEDLVLWFNLGMHHYTRSEDVPVTLYTEAFSSITFSPQNFFDRAQDGDLTNRRWIIPNANGSLAFEDYGVGLPTCSIQIEEPVLGIEKIV